MRHVGQDGRDDDIAVLAVGGLPKQTSPYAGISAAARVLAAIPDALRARAAEHAAENADVKGADVKDAAGDTSDDSTGGYAVVTSAPVQVRLGGGSSRSLSGSRSGGDDVAIGDGDGTGAAHAGALSRRGARGGAVRSPPG